MWHCLLHPVLIWQLLPVHTMPSTLDTVLTQLVPALPALPALPFRRPTGAAHQS
jgi:hypothetical protein